MLERVAATQQDLQPLGFSDKGSSRTSVDMSDQVPRYLEKSLDITPLAHEFVTPNISDSSIVSPCTPTEKYVKSEYVSIDETSRDNRTEKSNLADFPTLVNNDYENSMTEEEIRDVLFEAGYSTEDINHVLDSRPQISSGDSADSTIGSGVEACAGNAHDMLREIRIKHTNKIVIGTLNINSLASKFEQLKEIIGRNLDILTIQETKLDSSFPTQQFTLEGYSEPYRLDRNREGGGVLVYIREDIPSKQLSKHSFTRSVEGKGKTTVFRGVSLRP